MAQENRPVPCSLLHDRTRKYAHVFIRAIPHMQENAPPTFKRFVEEPALLCANNTNMAIFTHGLARTCQNPQPETVFFNLAYFMARTPVRNNSDACGLPCHMPPAAFTKSG
ncbi:hypothetical protein HK20_02850 [Acetobacter sp. DsW_54]|nr:hypothetical protein HK20_02850 [Acetobacter sp. DsW_54]